MVGAILAINKGVDGRLASYTLNKGVDGRLASYTFQRPLLFAFSFSLLD
jgi:hypothetical protein